MILCKEKIRITGIVQGVGFRPTVWRLANEAKLAGSVLNDGQGVLIYLWATKSAIDSFMIKLQKQIPPLARIDSIKRTPLRDNIAAPLNFSIISSDETLVQTHISPDAATCSKCIADVDAPFGRRFRYPLTNCTHCGPRFSIINAIPYDRVNTSMRDFSQCDSCQVEYESPTDRRFHAQANACSVCGPKVELLRIDGSPVCMANQLDDLDAACTLLQQGEIIVIKGIGGFHLACDATNAETVAKLRRLKQRFAKPFALMARDLAVIQRYVNINEQEQALLNSAAAPIVLCKKRQQDLRPIAEAVAPSQNTIGFMLPYTPLHQLMLKRMNRPIVLTSANHSEEPQVINNTEVQERLADIANYVLWHDRDIVNRVDDSVVRIMHNKARILRRARGYAPAPLPLPEGFSDTPDILAMGSELKNTFCLIKQNNAILSQHIGDLENAETYADYQKNLSLYANLFQHSPQAIVVDAHPEYLSNKLGRQWATQADLPLVEVQHHHAHIAACLAENKYPLHADAVLGVVLDGLGFGEDGTLWGGEFLHANYYKAERLATFKPVAMLGGSQAMRQPWRNTYAHLMAAMGWDSFKMNFHELELCRFLEQQALDTFSAMLKKGINTPLASSCGRLFDAVAAAMGICRTNASYEGQAAMELEAIVDQHQNDDEAYPFAICYLATSKMPYIEPLTMWQALFNDLILKTPIPIMSARFHKGLAKIIVTMIRKLTTSQQQGIINTVVLSGGVFQNKTLLEQVVILLEQADYRVLTHQHVPANDGGLALGQAMVAAANLLRKN